MLARVGRRSSDIAVAVALRGGKRRAFVRTPFARR
jgi:hypothetical protein